MERRSQTTMLWETALIGGDKAVVDCAVMPHYQAKMVDITYRSAVKNDAVELKSLFERSFVATFGHLYADVDLATFLQGNSTAVWVERITDPAIDVRIAVCGDNPVGYGLLGPVTLPVEPRGPALELRHLYFDSNHLGTGAAQTVIEWIISRVLEREAASLYLSVYEGNHRARAFYARYGFEEVGPYTFMVGDHADRDIILKLDVTS